MKLEVKTEKDVAEMGHDKIRRHFDEESKVWYFSVVDVIEVLVKTKDARNYWKVLKNRLNKTQNELVTKCNQLKMIAKDGKFYLTDTADEETMLQIIELISRHNILPFKSWFRSMAEEKNLVTDEAKLMIDGYQTDSEVCIKAMIAGVSPAELSVTVFSKKIIIRGKREFKLENSEVKYLNQELLWVNFSRIIELPVKVKNDSLETHEYNGLYTFKLQKII